MTSRPIAIYYEHPDWFRPLFTELDAVRSSKRMERFATEVMHR